MTKTKEEEIPNDMHVEIVICMTTCLVESRCKPLGCDKLQKTIKLLDTFELYRPYYEPSGIRDVTTRQPEQPLITLPSSTREMGVQPMDTDINND